MVNLLHNANDFLELIKKVSNYTVEISQLADFCYGKVVSVSPLKITVEQHMEFGKAQLVLTRNVSDFNIYITIDNNKKTVTVHNALQIGEQVILIRKKGGQKYLVIDRVINL